MEVGRVEERPGTVDPGLVVSFIIGEVNEDVFRVQAEECYAAREATVAL